MFYICNKNGVKKSKIVYIIELVCIFPLHVSDLSIIVPLGTIVNNINSSIIHKSLFISINNRYRKLNTISNFCITQYVMILDKISIVKLEISSNIGKQLVKSYSP